MDDDIKALRLNLQYLDEYTRGLRAHMQIVLDSLKGTP